MPSLIGVVPQLPLVQVGALQASPPAQLFPQAPQLLVVVRSVQDPLQQPWPAVQHAFAPQGVPPASRHVAQLLTHLPYALPLAGVIPRLLQ
jgi:hypothetical protein